MRALNCTLTSFATALLLACAMLLTSPVRAADEVTLQQFDVELIIFRVINPTGSPEDWDLEVARAKSSLPATRDTEEPVESGAATTATTGSDSSFQLLENGRFKLGAMEVALNRSRNYQVVAHIAWTQPGFPATSPRPLDIESLVPADSHISGAVTLTRGHYLHLMLDLAYKADDGKKYVLREQRRMRSGEKHYFDHPYFGALVLITPRG